MQFRKIYRERGATTSRVVLAVTKVEIANASVQAARIAILDIVEKSPGYKFLNNIVNNFLRIWV